MSDELERVSDDALFRALHLVDDPRDVPLAFMKSVVAECIELRKAIPYVQHKPGCKVEIGCSCTCGYSDLPDFVKGGG